MRFQPKSEQDIANDGLLQPGVYGFEITDAEDAISKSSGAEMIKLKVHVFSEDGTPNTIFDYLMEKVAYKLRHAAEACGMLGEYERGELQAIDFQGKTGRCKVVIQKDKTGQFPDKNSIADYLKGVAAAPHSAAPTRRQMAPAGADLDDSIPF